eukprot:6200310-Amphidinium_carterae.1
MCDGADSVRFVSSGMCGKLPEEQQNEQFKNDSVLVVCGTGVSAYQKRPNRAELGVDGPCPPRGPWIVTDGISNYLTFKRSAHSARSSKSCLLYTSPSPRDRG